MANSPFIGRHEPEILTHLELVVNTVCMEEAAQQHRRPKPEPFYS